MYNYDNHAINTNHLARKKYFGFFKIEINRTCKLNFYPLLSALYVRQV